jgi:hypothetical protein
MLVNLLITRQSDYKDLLEDIEVRNYISNLVQNELFNEYFETNDLEMIFAE